jgi:hypothetical protein
MGMVGPHRHVGPVVDIDRRALPQHSGCDRTHGPQGPDEVVWPRGSEVRPEVCSSSRAENCRLSDPAEGDVVDPRAAAPRSKISTARHAQPIRRWETLPGTLICVVGAPGSTSAERAFGRLGATPSSGTGHRLQLVDDAHGCQRCPTD